MALKASEMEKIKLEAQFRNGIAVSLGFSGTFGLAFGFGFGAGFPLPIWTMFPISLFFWLAAWGIHCRAAKVLEKLDKGIG